MQDGQTVKAAIGLHLDLDNLRAIIEEIRDIQAERHVDVVLVRGDKKIEMSLDEFIERIER